MHVETVAVTADGYFIGFWMNCYILCADEDSQSVVIVDPGGKALKILEAIGDRAVSAIILTHYHYDHNGALDGLYDIWSNGTTPIYIHALDYEPLLSELAKRHRAPERLEAMRRVIKPLKDGDMLEAAGLNLQVMHTPGHSLGSMCLYAKDAGILLSGDTIFKGTTGRTDLKGGNPRQMYDSLQILATLPDETLVYPGHEQTTTIAFERLWSLIEYELE